MKLTFQTRTGISARFIELSGNFPIVCGGSIAQKEKLTKTNMLGFVAHVFEFDDLITNNLYPLPTKARATESELRLHLNCALNGR